MCPDLDFIVLTKRKEHRAHDREITTVFHIESCKVINKSQGFNGDELHQVTENTALSEWIAVAQLIRGQRLSFT